MAKQTSLTIESFYWLPYCSTCTKAEQFLLEPGAQIERYVNLKEEPLGAAEIKQLSQLIGGPVNLFSKRAMKYRSMGLDQMDLSEADLLRYMEQEYTFIKRPVLVVAAKTGDKKILAGFSAKQYQTLFD